LPVGRILFSERTAPVLEAVLLAFLTTTIYTMSITFSCRKCERKFTIGDEFAGKRTKCPCGLILTVPNVSEDNLFNSNSTLNPSVGGFLDIGFTQFITPVWISVFWIICIILEVILFLASLVLIGIIATAAGGAFAFAFILLPVSIIFHLLQLLGSRILLETIIIQFRIEKNTRVTEKILAESRKIRRAMRSKQQ
jgi:hypothetical protein